MKLPGKVVLRLLAAASAILFLAAAALIVQTRGIVREEILARALAYHREVVRGESSKFNAITGDAALQGLALAQSSELRRFLANGESPETRERATRRLRSFLERNPLFSALAVVGSDFNLALELVREGDAVLAAPDWRNFFEEGVDPFNAMAKIPVFIDAVEGDPLPRLRLTIPVLDADNLLLGVLALDLDLGRLFDALDLSASDYPFFVLDENGRILHSETTAASIPPAEELLDSETVGEIVRRRKGNLSIGADDEFLLVFSRLEARSGAQYAATVGRIIPYQAIFRPLRLVMETVSLGIAAVLGLALCAFAVFAYRQVQPISRLAESMLAYKPGGAPAIRTADRERKDEIGRLYGAFEQMGNVLHDAFSRLSRQMHDLETANRDLRDKTEEAQRLAQAKSDFLAVMSHEIRTPVNAIIGFSQLLEQETDEGERLHCIRRIAENSERLLFLIENILDFTRLQSGRVRLVEEDFHLQAELEFLGEVFARRIDAAKVSLEIRSDAAEGQLFLRGDVHRLRQILSNLLENAAKFTERGFIRLRTSVGCQASDNVIVEFAVEDSGIGIPKEKIGAIFDPFEQVDPGSSRRYEGTGLGLAIVKRLSEAMGGTITVQSEPGVGTAFTLRLPFVRTEKIPGNGAGEGRPASA